MLRKIFLGTIVFFGFISAKAQTDSTAATKAQTDSTKPAAPTSPAPTITGSVDAYFRYNFNDPKAKMVHVLIMNNYTSFTNSQNSFELGMASIRADHSFGKASATIDLGFGRRAEEFRMANPDHPTLFAVKQAFISYAVSDKLKFTIGKWATHIGYEVTDAYLNRNYSMDYMFSYGPFSHTGLKADIGLGKKSALMLGVANTTDMVAILVRANMLLRSSAQELPMIKLNFMSITRDLMVALSVLLNLMRYLLQQLPVNSVLGIMVPYKRQNLKAVSAASWWGSAVYLNLDPSSTFGITLRGEYFDNKKAVVCALRLPVYLI